jgi:DNA-binding SARP family transcriptional activator
MLEKSPYFGVLGPLEVTMGGVPLPLRRNRQLVVLAMLLLRANRAVPVNQLVDALWPRNPPSTAVGQVQTCIWSLRRMLTADRGGCNVIETNSTGYTLHVPDGNLDTDVFEMHVRAADEAAARMNRAEAVECGRRALATVRGVVLGEIDSPVVQALAAKWEERRLLVVEQCIEWELEQGKFVGIIPELASLVRQFPLRERLLEQYLRALHGNGQRAEALSAYRAGRHVIASQLGLEPSGTLQSLQQRILAGESAEDSPLQQQLSVTGTVPVQLPPPVVTLVGRVGAVDTISSLLAGRLTLEHRIALVVGPIGSGKSALVVRIAHDHRALFPDGVLYVDMGAVREKEENSPISTALRSFLFALGMSEREIPSHEADRVTLYRSLTATRRVLVVVDNMDHVDNVVSLLPFGSGCALLATSRRERPDLQSARTVRLGPLGDSEAVALLASIVGNGRVEAEPDSALSLVRAAGNLPITTCALATRLASRPQLPLGHAVAQLRDSHRAKRLLTHNGINLRTRLAASVEELPADARWLWSVLSDIPVPDFAVWLVARIAGTTVPRADELLELLLDRGLMELVGPDPAGQMRYGFNRAVRVFAMAQAAEQISLEERDAARTRAARAWIELVGTDGDGPTNGQTRGSGDTRLSSGPPAPRAEWGGELGGGHIADRYRIPRVDPAIRFAAEREGYDFAVRHLDAEGRYAGL